MILQSKLLALVNEVLNQNAKLRKGGRQATYFCCFCNHYKRKLEINLETGQWQCWVCHARGSYLGSLLSKVNAPRHYRDELFALTKDVRLQRRKRKSTEPEEPKLPDDFIPMLQHPKETADNLDNRWRYKILCNYLKKRGVTLEDICRYNIGYCLTGEYSDCILVPSYDDDGKINYYSCRYVIPHPWIKYKNAPFSKNIIGFECFINFSEPVTIVEGVFDAIAVRVNAVPLFGTSISEKLMLALIINKTPYVNLVLDDDALEQSLDIYERLRLNNIKVNLVELPKKDPSDLGFNVTHDLIVDSKRFDESDLLKKKLQLAL